MIDAHTHLINRHRQSRGYFPPRIRSQYEKKKEHNQASKAPELFDLLCLAILAVCICLLLSEGVKQAMLNDSDPLLVGRLLSIKRQIKNSTLLTRKTRFGAQQQRHAQSLVRSSPTRQSSFIKHNKDDFHTSNDASKSPGSEMRNSIAPRISTMRPLNAKEIPDTPVTRRILALGGSTTWGAKLQSRKNAYPTVLSNLLGPGWESVNVAIRATGASLPSQCIQSMIRNAGYGEHDFDVILFEYSLNGLKNLSYLVKRLRRRYPKAIFVYIDLYSLRMNIQDSVSQAKPSDVLREGLKAIDADGKISKMILETPQSNWVWNKPTINFAKKVYLEALDIIGQVDGYMYGFPMPQYPAEAMKWFVLDFHHLNADGHRHVAKGLLNLLRPLQLKPPPNCRSSPRDCDGTWGKGDSCYSWFETGDVSQLIINGGRMLEFAPSKFALHIGGKFGSTASISFRNPFHDSQPVEISYMSWRDPSIYPKFKATLTSESGKSTSAVIDPINPVEPQRIYHITVSTPLGWVEPGQNTMTITTTETAEAPARLIGIILCGACAEMNYTSAG